MRKTDMYIWVTTATTCLSCPLLIKHTHMFEQSVKKNPRRSKWKKNSQSVGEKDREKFWALNVARHRPIVGNSKKKKLNNACCSSFGVAQPLMHPFFVLCAEFFIPTVLRQDNEYYDMLSYSPFLFHHVAHVTARFFLEIFSHNAMLLACSPEI